MTDDTIPTIGPASRRTAAPALHAAATPWQWRSADKAHLVLATATLLGLVDSATLPALLARLHHVDRTVTLPHTLTPTGPLTLRIERGAGTAADPFIVEPNIDWYAALDAKHPGAATRAQMARAVDAAPAKGLPWVRAAALGKLALRQTLIAALTAFERHAEVANTDSRDLTGHTALPPADLAMVVELRTLLTMAWHMPVRGEPDDLAQALTAAGFPATATRVQTCKGWFAVARLGPDAEDDA